MAIFSFVSIKWLAKWLAGKAPCSHWIICLLSSELWVEWDAKPYSLPLPFQYLLSLLWTFRMFFVLIKSIIYIYIFICIMTVLTVKDWKKYSPITLLTLQVAKCKYSVWWLTHQWCSVSCCMSSTPLPYHAYYHISLRPLVGPMCTPILTARLKHLSGVSQPKSELYLENRISKLTMRLNTS